MSFTQTTTYNQPALAYGAVTGCTLNSFSLPNPTVIPLTLDTYSGVQAPGSLVSIGVLPIVVNDNLAYGGVAIGEGSTGLPRINIGGFMSVAYSGTTTSALQINSTSATWADFIIMCMEGRVDTTWQRYDPLWFRDPYGRQFNNVRIFDFTAAYVEQVPGRTNFTATLITT